MSESITCQCHRCLNERLEAVWWMILCPVCGNKRCPHATDHRNTCTSSNEPGQIGSVYGTVPAYVPAVKEEAA